MLDVGHIRDEVERVGERLVVEGAAVADGNATEGRSHGDRSRGPATVFDARIRTANTTLVFTRARADHHAQSEMTTQFR